MLSRFSGYRWVLFVLWVLAFAAIPVWNAVDPGDGRDTKIYLNAIHSVQAGHDPYADGIAVQEAIHAQLALHPHTQLPYSYVYSPVTLPLLRMIGFFPLSLLFAGYWLIYAAGALAQIWAGMQAAEPKERRYAAFLAPAAAFFPGLLQHDVLLSGNIAYILYGAIFLTALLCWRRGKWHWFYLAVLAASCFKIPMLSLLAIPLLSARKQWLPACITAAAGVGLFTVQLWIWPVYFCNYLRAVELQFSYNHDFGVGPAGLFGLALFDAGIPYSPASMIFYSLYALPLFGLLFFLSRQFLSGKFALEQWIPVMVTGVILLNPRIKEYDVAPLSLLMALILWRVISTFTRNSRATLFSFLFLISINIVIIFIEHLDAGKYYWKHTEGILLAGIFAAGCWNLLRQTRESAIKIGIPSTIG